jgi:tRNA pseudouridine55 synthase
MARRRKGKAVHGWVVLDKPPGMTSTAAVGAVRRIFDANKAGHAGTLDPLATGVLPIALGEATKTVPFAVAGAKRYRFTVRWGIETDTDDASGRTLHASAVRPDAGAIAASLARFTGEIWQVPPAFSAIKVAGQRAYDLAREGTSVELAARRVAVEHLELVATPDHDTAVFEAVCGKGTYVRALARDLGRMLGSFGHLIALRRTAVASFKEERAVTLAELLAQGTKPASCLMPIEAALEGLAPLSVGRSDAARLRRGQAILVRGRDAAHASGPTYATSEGHLVAIGRLERGELTPTRVFHFT